jgi:beta-lactamase class A
VRWLRALVLVAVLAGACSDARPSSERGPSTDPAERGPDAESADRRRDRPAIFHPADPDRRGPHAESAAPPAPGPGGPVRLGEALATVLEDREDSYGVVVEHVPTGQRFERNQDRTFPSASVYKLAVAYEVLRRAGAGQLHLDEPLVIEPADAVEAEPELGLAAGEQVTVRQALEAMMSVSSNAAAHGLMRRIGRAELNRSLSDLGLRDTGVPLLRPEANDSSADGESDRTTAVTTPADMAHLLRLLARDRLLDEPSRDELRRLLAFREDLDPLANSLPDDAQVLAKVGTLERASNVAGLVYTPRGPVIICVFDEDVDPGDARAVSGDIARAVYDLLGH